MNWDFDYYRKLFKQIFPLQHKCSNNIFITGQCIESSYKGTIQIICVDEKRFQVQKCVWSETYYTLIIILAILSKLSLYDDNIYQVYVSKICPNYIYFNYQLILHSVNEEHKYGLGGINGIYSDATMCNTSNVRFRGKKWQEIMDYSWVCDKTRNDKLFQSIVSCDMKSFCPKDSEIITSCDLHCDSLDCFDEALCNGFLYGIICKKGKTQTYIKPIKICDSVWDCDGGEDETRCFDWDIKSDTQMCMPSAGNEWIPIHNFTRCAALDIFPRYTFGNISIISNFDHATPLCVNYLDQMNCTDAKRVVLTCPIKGFMTTLSPIIICVSPYLDSLCDDDFDVLCKEPSFQCRVHKHQLCDGNFDCVDQSDENNRICHEMTEETCARRYRHEMPLSLPISWLSDGIQDCIRGEDELNLWPTCKVSTSSRYLPEGFFCENVFKCGPETTEFVKLESMCNGLNTCFVEEAACKITRPSKNVLSKAYYHESLWRDIAGFPTKFVSYCIPGIALSMGRHISLCSNETFQIPDSGILGVTAPYSIVLPEKKHECSSLYGEQYVFMTCKNRCLNSLGCPLKVEKITKACGGEKYKESFISVTRDGTSLAFLRTRTMQLHSGIMKNSFIQIELFHCENSNCIAHDKVCNLVDDCGDLSDETNCSNIFSCNLTRDFIPISQKCNGIVQCSDYSDECGKDCGKQIISGIMFKVVSWIIGVVAVILNFTHMINNFISLAENSGVNKPVINTTFTLLINIGDLLTGIYLLCIVIVDSIIYREGYCKQQHVWLSSTMCSSLGVVSTFGAQISLFSMALFSVFRLSEVFNLKFNMLENLLLEMAGLIMTVTIPSLVIAIGPLLSSFEDLFVNGMTYNPNVKLFLPYVNKKTHMGVIESFYGNLRWQGDMSWQRINLLIDEMFTSDYNNGTLDRRKIHFYGADGVCLFKYFVQNDDPQKTFVWLCLGVNLFCFLTISLCYGLIIVITEISGETVELEEIEEMQLVREKKKDQRKIALIILTDFVCWVPFIFVCGLHSLELIDATPTYPIFSLIILPINSVINPLINGNFLKKQIFAKTKQLFFSLQLRLINLLGLAPNVTQDIPDEGTEMNIIPATAQTSNLMPFIIPKIIITGTNSFGRKNRTIDSLFQNDLL